MFEINDMAKAAFESVLSTPLQRAQKMDILTLLVLKAKRKLSTSPRKSMWKTMKIQRKKFVLNSLQN